MIVTHGGHCTAGAAARDIVSAKPDAHFAPSLAARFRPERTLGQGGFGLVWLAIQLDFDRPVAIKLLIGGRERDAHEVERFLAEARITAALPHPGIVKMLDFGVADEQPWIAYEYLAGTTLAALIEPGPLEPGRAFALAAQAARALHAAHEGGVLHRDVKPENLFLVDEAVKVTDFGIARLTAGSSVKTATGVVIGSPAYLAPEVIRGDPATVASDVYALGITLYELITGQPPFAEKNVLMLLQRHMESPVPPASSRRPGLPPAADVLLEQALAKDPAKRFATAAAFADALEAIDLRRVAPAVASSAGRSPVSRSAATRSVTRNTLVAPPAAGRSPAARLALPALLLGLCGLIALRAARSPDPLPSPTASVASVAPAAPAPSGPPATIEEFEWFLGGRTGLVDAMLSTTAPLFVELARRGSVQPAWRKEYPPARWHHHQIPLAFDTPYRLNVSTPRGPWQVRNLAFRSRKQSWQEEQLANMTIATLIGGRHAIRRLADEHGHLPEEPLAERFAKSRDLPHFFDLLRDLTTGWNSPSLCRMLVARTPAGASLFDRLNLIEMAARCGEPWALTELRALPPLADQRRLHPLTVDAYVRLMAALEDPSKAFEEIRRTVETGDVLPAWGFAIALHKLDPAQAATVFGGWVAGQPRDKTRARVGALGLGLTGREADVKTLGQILTAPGEPYLLRAAAAEALGRARTAQATMALLGSLTPGVDRAPPTPDALWALARLGSREAAPAAERLLATSESVTLRAAAAGLIGCVRADHRKELEARLSNPSRELRAVAAWALGRVKDPFSLHRIHTFAMSDGDADGVGAWAMAQIGGPETVDELLELARQLEPRTRANGGPGKSADAAAADLRRGMAVLGAWTVARGKVAPLLPALSHEASEFTARLAIHMMSMDKAPPAEVVVQFPFLHVHRTGMVVAPGDVLQVSEHAAWQERDERGCLSPLREKLPGVPVRLGVNLIEPVERHLVEQAAHVFINRPGELQLASFPAVVQSALMRHPARAIAGVTLIRIRRLAPGDLAASDRTW